MISRSGHAAAVLGALFLPGPSGDTCVSVTPMAVPPSCVPLGPCWAADSAMTADAAFRFHLEQERGRLGAVGDGARHLLPAQHQPQKWLIASCHNMSHDTAQKPVGPRETCPQCSGFILVVFARKRMGHGVTIPARPPSLLQSPHGLCGARTCAHASHGTGGFAWEGLSSAALESFSVACNPGQMDFPFRNCCCSSVAAPERCRCGCCPGVRCRDGPTRGWQGRVSSVSHTFVVCGMQGEGCSLPPAFTSRNAVSSMC